MANRVKRNCTDDSEFVRAKSEYTNYLLRAGYNISSNDNAFQNVQLLSLFCFSFSKFLSRVCNLYIHVFV